MTISNSLDRLVENSLRVFLVQRGKGDLVRLDIVRVIERPFSRVVFYRAITSTQTYDAVLKKVVHHPDNLVLTKSENQAEVEYAMLSTLFPHFKTVRHCSVPEPIAVFPSHEAYLMEYVTGVLLSDKFKAARYLSKAKDFSSLNNWCKLCGCWLKRFQDVTAVEPAPVGIFSATMERCEEKLNMINNVHDRRCPIGLKDAVMAGLQSELQKLGNDSVLAAGRHGDFGWWNILAHERGITVFDFLGSQTDSIAIDVLKMLVNFEVEKCCFSASRKKVERLEKSFLEGYGPIPKIQRPVAVICETLHRVCSLCTSVVPADGIGVRRKFEMHLSFRKHLAWLYANKKQLLWTNLLE